MSAEKFIVTAREKGHYVEYTQETLPLWGEIPHPKIVQSPAVEQSRIFGLRLEGPATAVWIREQGGWVEYQRPLLPTIESIPTRGQMLRSLQEKTRDVRYSYARHKLLELGIEAAGIIVVAASILSRANLP